MAACEVRSLPSPQGVAAGLIDRQESAPHAEPAVRRLLLSFCSFMAAASRQAHTGCLLASSSHKGPCRNGHSPAQLRVRPAMSNWLRNFGAARESAFFKVEQACLAGLQQP